MKTRNSESFDILAAFALTNEEMISIRGGNDGDPGPTTPPVKI